MGENISLSADFAQVLSEQLKVVKGFGAIEDAIVKSVKQSEGFVLDKAGNKVETMVKNFVLLNQHGTEVSITTKKINGEWVATSQAVKDTTKSLEAQAGITAKQLAAAKALKTAQARKETAKKANVARRVGRGSDAVTTQSSKALTTPGLTAKQTLAYVKQEEVLLSLVQKHELGSRVINKVFRDVANGNILKYEGGLNQVRDAVSKLLDLNKDFATSADKAAKKATAALKAEADAEDALIAKKEKRKRIADGIRNGLAGVRESNSQAKAIRSPNLGTSDSLAFTKRLEGLNSFIQKNRVGAEDVKRVWTDILNGVVKSYGKQLNGVRDQINGLVETQKKFASTSTKATKEAADALKKYKNEAKKAREVWKTLAKLQLTNVLSRGIGSLVNDLKQATVTAGELSKSIAQISTIDVSNTSLEKIKQDVLDLSNASGLDVLDVATAQYQALSNQVVTSANAFQFLNEANKLAIGTLSTSAQAVNILSSTINAFGLTSASAESISSSFFKTLELGRLRLGEISDSFGRLAVIANQAGVSLNETQATLALFTRQGIKANQASTLMRAIMLKLIKPTKNMSDFLADLGFASGDAAIKALGFGKVMQLVEQEATRTGSTLTDLGAKFSRVRAITGAAIFSGTGIEQFNRDLEAITNSTGAIEGAFKTIEASAGHTVQRGVNLLKNALTEGLGSAIIETLGSVDESTDAFQSMANVLKFAGSHIVGLGGVIGAFAVVKLGAMAVATYAASAASTAHATVLELESQQSAKVALQTNLLFQARLSDARATHLQATANLKSQAIMARSVAALRAAVVSLGSNPAVAGALLVIGGLSAAYIHHSALSVRALENVQAKARETAERFGAIQSKLTSDTVAQFALNQARIDTALRRAFHDDAANITKSIQENSEARKALVKSLQALGEANSEITLKTLTHFDSEIAKSTDTLAKYKSELERVVGASKSLAKTIADLKLEQDLEGVERGLSKSFVIDDRIEDLGGPVKGTNEDGSRTESEAAKEEARLKRIIELIKKKLSLDVSSQTAKDFKNELLEAYETLKALYDTRPAEIKKQVVLENVNKTELETSKKDLTKVDSRITDYVKELAALKVKGKELGRQRELIEKILALEVRRDKIITGSNAKGANLQGLKDSGLSDERLSEVRDLVQNSRLFATTETLLGKIAVNTAKSAEAIKARNTGKSFREANEKLIKSRKQVNANVEFVGQFKRLASEIQALGGAPAVNKTISTSLFNRNVANGELVSSSELFKKIAKPARVETADSVRRDAEDNGTFVPGRVPGLRTDQSVYQAEADRRNRVNREDFEKRSELLNDINRVLKQFSTDVVLRNFTKSKDNVPVAQDIVERLNKARGNLGSKLTQPQAAEFDKIVALFTAFSSSLQATIELPKQVETVKAQGKQLNKALELAGKRGANLDGSPNEASQILKNNATTERLRISNTSILDSGSAIKGLGVIAKEAGDALKAHLIATPGDGVRALNSPAPKPFGVTQATTGVQPAGTVINIGGINTNVTSNTANPQEFTESLGRTISAHVERIIPQAIRRGTLNLNR